MHEEGWSTAGVSPVLRLILMGTGPFAVPSFEALCAAGHDCLLVVTRPEKSGLPQGQGKKPVVGSPVRQWAEARNLPVEAPDSINDPEAVQMLKELKPDLLVVCDYGQILRPAALAVAKLGGINLHGSLLPAYRGAAPVQWAVLDGDAETGACIIHMTPKLDAGPIISLRRTAILPQETAGQLEERLAKLGVEATLEAVAALLHSRDSGTPLDAIPQDCEQASKAPRLSKADGRILWTRPAHELDCHVRGMQPWPGAFTEVPVSAGGKGEPTRLMITELALTDKRVEGEVAAGTVRGEGQELWVATGDFWVRVQRLKPAGKREMSAAEWLRGRPISAAVVLR